MRDVTLSPAVDSDIPALARLIHFAFASPIDGAASWLRSSGVEHLRVVRAEQRPVALPSASLMRIPMGQRYGGRVVPMMGIAGVAVAPEARGGGLALGMMRAAVRQIADEMPLSALYASTQALYRQAGYEQAGHRVQTTLPLGAINVRERSGTLVPLTEAHRPSIKACYDRYAAAFDGALDRGPYVWGRIENWHGESYEGFGVLAPGADARDPGSPLHGYVYFVQRRKTGTTPAGKHDIGVSDLAFTTPEAGRRILGFLADFAMVAETAVFHGAPHHPLLALLPLQVHHSVTKEAWMLRICDFKRAVEARGYSPAVRATVTVGVTDDVVGRNTGVWRLDVADGACAAARLDPDPRRAPADAVHADIRGFVPVYTGLMSPAQARLAGLVHGSDAALSALGAVFPAGSPWTSDFF